MKPCSRGQACQWTCLIHSLTLKDRGHPLLQILENWLYLCVSSGRSHNFPEYPYTVLVSLKLSKTWVGAGLEQVHLSVQWYWLLPTSQAHTLPPLSESMSGKNIPFPFMLLPYLYHSPYNFGDMSTEKLSYLSKAIELPSVISEISP